MRKFQGFSLIVLSFMSVLAVHAEGNSIPEPQEPGMTIFRTARGDLDGDGLEDLAVVYRGTDPNLRHPAQSPAAEPETVVDETTGRTVVTLLVDSNPRLLRVFLREGDHYRVVACTQKLIPSASGSMGESLSRFEIADGRLHVDLTSMNRRHGEVFARARYGFVCRAEKLFLAEQSRVDIDRHLSDQEVRCDYDFLKSQRSELKMQWSTGAVRHSETKPMAVSELPRLESISPDWKYSEAP